LPVWKHIIKQLSRRRTLTPGDGPALTIYCRTFLHWKAAAHEVETNGVMVVETRQSKQGELYDIRVINPAVKVAADLAANLKDSLKEFGLTGISRDKVSEVKPRESKTPEPGTVDYFRKAAAKAEEFALTLNDVTETLLQTQEKEEGNGEPTATRS
jgi:P27 family predicted phage terminase small subunit